MKSRFRNSLIIAALAATIPTGVVLFAASKTPGKPMDEERAKAVSIEVKEWKTKRELYLPNFPAEKIAAIKNSLEYPVEGSPQFSQARA